MAGTMFLNIPPIVVSGGERGGGWREENDPGAGAGASAVAK